MSADKFDGGYKEYCGMSYEQASKEAERLIGSIGWFRAFDRLSVLHFVMEIEMNRSRLKTVNISQTEKRQ